MKTRTVASPIVFCSLLLISGLIMGALGLRCFLITELASYLEVFAGCQPGLGRSDPELSRPNLKSVALLWAFRLA